jgi:hypothetical protein
VELSYRRLHTQPNAERYQEGYEAARAAKDDFAARFYLRLLADRELAAGRTQGALVHLATLSSASPQDTELSLKVAALQAWFGREQDLAATRRRILTFARGTDDARLAGCAARVGSLLASSDKAELDAALALGGTAVKVGKAQHAAARPHGAPPVTAGTGGGWDLLALGMAEYRGGHDAAAEEALLAAAKAGPNNATVSGIAAFYRAMSLFRLGKPDEARKLAITAAAKMKPLPKDENNPLAGNGTPDDLILWLASKEAKAMIKFDAAPPPRPEGDRK